MRDYYEQRRKEIEAAIARETALLQLAARGDHRKLVREPHHPARRGHARPAGRRDPRRRLQQGEREARGGRQAGGPRHRDAPPQSGARRRGTARGRHVHRHRHVRRLPRAGARVLEDDQARARAVRARAHRPRQGPVVRRLPRDRLPAAGRPRATSRDARQRFANVGCEACHGAGQQAWRGRSTSGARSRAPSRRRPAAAATPPTSRAATSTTRSSSQAIVGPGHTLAPGPAPPL